MSGAGMGTIGVNKVAQERLNVNVNAPKWAHPGGQLPKTRAFLESPPRFSGVMLLAGCGASFLFYWINRRMYTTTVESMTPEFQEAVRKIGPVAERSGAPPVFLNPITNRIPGYYRGPDDIPTGL